MNKLAISAALMLSVVIVAPALAKTYKMATPTAQSAATPDTIEIPLGTLKLNDGVPTPETVEKIYDNLDRSGVRIR